MFTDPLHYKTLIPGKLWRLIKPLQYVFSESDAVKYGRREIIVPPGYVTDLYSIPWPFSCLWPKDIDPQEPPVLHDYLLTHMYMTFTRKQAHDVFYDAMIKTDVPVVRRELFYAAVHLVKGKDRLIERKKLLAKLGLKCGANGQPKVFECK